LNKILTAHQKHSATKGKGKKKKDGFPSPPIPVEKKTANKNKKKEVIHNKKASSSKDHD
jgi:hypothetical protein